MDTYSKLMLPSSSSSIRLRISVTPQNFKHSELCKVMANDLHDVYIECVYLYIFIVGLLKVPKTSRKESKSGMKNALAKGLKH